MDSSWIIFPSQMLVKYTNHCPIKNIINLDHILFRMTAQSCDMELLSELPFLPFDDMLNGLELANEFPYFCPKQEFVSSISLSETAPPNTDASMPFVCSHIERCPDGVNPSLAHALVVFSSCRATKMGHSQTLVPGRIPIGPRLYAKPGSNENGLNLGKGRKLKILNLVPGQSVRVSVMVPSGEPSQFYLSRIGIYQMPSGRHSVMSIQGHEEIKLGRVHDAKHRIVHLVRFDWLDQAGATINTTQLEFESRSNGYEKSTSYRQKCIELDNTVLDLHTSQIVRYHN